jgi:hypothetical protein
MPRLNQLFNRAQPTQEDIHILRGIAKAMQKAARAGQVSAASTAPTAPAMPAAAVEPAAASNAAAAELAGNGDARGD